MVRLNGFTFNDTCTISIYIYWLMSRLFYVHSCLCFLGAFSVAIYSTDLKSLTITWALAANMTVANYTIDYSNTGTVCLKAIISISGIPASETRYTLGNLNEGTRYTINVTAQLNGGGTYEDRVTASTHAGGEAAYVLVCVIKDFTHLHHDLTFQLRLPLPIPSVHLM